MIKIELGCGQHKREGYFSTDLRITNATDFVSDAKKLPIKDNSVDEIKAICLLEHFDDPYPILDEIARVLKKDGTLHIRLPNIGTYSAHLDITHKFLADLRLWKEILSGYFNKIRILPVGIKYRDNLILKGINYFFVKILKFYELAQGWDFICSKKKDKLVKNYKLWYQE